MNKSVLRNRLSTITEQILAGYVFVTLGIELVIKGHPLALLMEVNSSHCAQTRILDFDIVFTSTLHYKGELLDFSICFCHFLSSPKVNLQSNGQKKILELRL